MAEDKPSKRKGGRPRAAVPGTKVGVWVPTPTYDTLCKLAKRHELSVSAVTRRVLEGRLRATDDDEES